jgi:hypothetical protein
MGLQTKTLKRDFIFDTFLTLGFILRTFNDQLRLDDEEEGNSLARNSSEKSKQSYGQKK